MSGGWDDGKIEACLKDIEFEDDMGEELQVLSWEPLSEERRVRYAKSLFPELGEEGVVAMAVSLTGDREAVVALKDGKGEQCVVEDCISMADLSPCDLVEYRFKEGTQEWLVSKVSMETLTHYRSKKFEMWKKLLFGVWKECLASFVRMLQGGPICQMFDHTVFPEAEGEQKQWQVLDSNGKVRQVPHPVAEMRAYNPKTKKYEAIDTRLEGAPEPDEVEKFWQATLQELRGKTENEVGKDFIDDCFNLDLETLQLKYI